MVRNIYDCFLIAVLFVLSLVGGAWSACHTYPVNSTCTNNTTYSLSYCNSSFNLSISHSCPGTSSAYTCNIVGTGSATCSGSISFGSCIVNGSKNFTYTYTYTYCDTQQESDSLACLNNGNLWIDGSCCDEECVCLRDGGQWVNGFCQNCNDHIPVPDKCMETWKNGYSTDADGNPGGGGYWAITTYECFYDSCAMSLNCTEKSSFPAGNLTCDDFQDTTTNQNCVAVIGHQCTIQCGNNITKNCDCDGSCEHAKTLPACQCPQMSSSSVGSSSSGESSSSGDNPQSSSSGENPQSSESGPSSSNSPVDSIGNGDWEYNYSGVLNEIEWNTRQTATNTNIAAGYLSSIDKWQSTINFNMQQESNKIQSAISSGATQVANAGKATTDSLHHTNELLGEIKGSLGSLGDSVDMPDISGWLDSSQALIENLKNPDTTYLNPDSLKNDTSQFKSKYSGLFLSNVYTRNGCYEFKMTRPQQNSKFGRAFSSDIELDFGNLAGTFDLCAIFRGIVRIAGAVLVILISLMSYRAAFSSGSGD